VFAYLFRLLKELLNVDAAFNGPEQTPSNLEVRLWRGQRARDPRIVLTESCIS